MGVGGVGKVRAVCLELKEISGVLLLCHAQALTLFSSQRNWKEIPPLLLLIVFSLSDFHI